MENDRIVTSHELQEELKLTAESIFKVNTNMPSLDRILSGVEAGELIVVTGPTGGGKTTLLMSVTQNMAENKIDTLWFTLEVTPRQFINKLTKRNSTLPLFYLPNKGYDDVNPEFLKWFEKEHRRPFAMIDWVEVKIKEAIARVKTDGRELKVVFIDHIHGIFSLARVERNISLEIGDMVSKIKNIAIQHNLIIFLVAHCKDDPMGSTREPRKEDIRDSGLIIRVADSIVGVWRIPNGSDGTETRQKPINEGDNKAKVAVWKNRREGNLGFFTGYVKNHYFSEQQDNDWGGF